MVPIKLLLVKQEGIVANFAMHSKFLQKKANTLHEITIFEMALKDEMIHQEAQNWLRSISKP